MNDNVIVPENYAIKPSNINTSQPFLGAFDKMGREVLANAIVQLCQGINYWCSFSREELANVCQITGANIYFLKDLIEMGYIVADKQDRYCVTIQFVKKCHAIAPNNK